MCIRKDVDVRGQEGEEEGAGDGDEGKRNCRWDCVSVGIQPLTFTCVSLVEGTHTATRLLQKSHGK